MMKNSRGGGGGIANVAIVVARSIEQERKASLYIGKVHLKWNAVQ
jgi:hypothetical protein